MYAIRSYYDNSIELTPQESEQLSVYVSDDVYVKKQKEDIEELTKLFSGMLQNTDGADVKYEFIKNLRENYKPVITSYSIHYTKLYDRV